MIVQDVYPQARQDVEYRELDDGGVVYDTQAEKIHTLNATAAFVWSLCDGGSSAAQIADGLEQITGISSEQALNDVARLLQDFAREGLLERK